MNCTCCEVEQDRCRVLEEIRNLRKPREWHMERYNAQLRARRAELERGLGPKEVAFRLGGVGIPETAYLAAQEGRATTATVATRRWLEGDRMKRPLLLLAGPTGTGKTVAAALACQEYARTAPWERATGQDTQPIHWCQASWLTSVSDWRQADGDRLEQLSRARLLVVDDVGREVGKAGAQRLANLVMQRCDRARRTVLTTNLDGKALLETYGSALVDRIRSMGDHPKLGTASERAKQTAEVERDG